MEGSMGPCFRVPFAADAVRAGEKRKMLGLTLKDTIDKTVKDISSPLAFGDHIIIEVRDKTTGKLKIKLKPLDKT
jgi:hypothetical protein